jgi:ribonuclease Z|tara:strand:- start:127 stop:957 length:831 start_codon:yes stop_codon:yes gene_type:complete
LILGSGTPNPDPERSGSAYAIVTNGQSYLVDFGPGVIRRASAFSPSWGGEFESMEIQNLNYAFLTHLHSDHSAGLADLILSPWVLEREEPLNLFGPRGLKRMADKITDAYQIDIDYRINGSQPSNLEGYKTKVTEIAEGIIYEDKYIAVEAFENNHGDFKNSFGFVFTTKDKKIVISGDTAYSQKVIEKSKEADILVHEVYSEKGFKEKTKDWQIYHKAHHTSAPDVGKIASMSKPKKLVLSHILFWGNSKESIVEEVKSNFDGEVIIAEDLMVID